MKQTVSLENSSQKSAIVDYLNGKYADPSANNLLDTASFVDPQFKSINIGGEKFKALKLWPLTRAAAARMTTL